MNPRMIGDVNNDGIIDVEDLEALKRIVASAENQQNGDVNGDGVVNAKDIAALKKIIRKVEGK